MHDPVHGLTICVTAIARAIPTLLSPSKTVLSYRFLMAYFRC